MLINCVLELTELNLASTEFVRSVWPPEDISSAPSGRPPDVRSISIGIDASLDREVESILLLLRRCSDGDICVCDRIRKRFVHFWEARLRMLCAANELHM